MSQQFLPILIFGFFAVGFLGAWLKNQKFSSALVLSISYAIACAAFLMELLFFQSHDFAILTPFGDSLYLLSSLIFAVGLVLKFEIRVPEISLGFVFTMAMVSTHWFWFAQDNHTARTEIIAYACAAMTAIAAATIYKKAATKLDRWIFASVCLFSAQFVLTTVISLYVSKHAEAVSAMPLPSYLEFLHLTVGLVAFLMASLILASYLLAIRATEERKGELGLASN